MTPIEKLATEIEMLEQECSAVGKEIDVSEWKYNKLMAEAAKKRATLKSMFNKQTEEQV